VRARVTQQLLDDLADAAASSDWARDSVKECALVSVILLVELSEEDVIAHSGDVLGRFLRFRPPTAGCSYSTRSNGAKREWGSDERLPAHCDGEGLGGRTASRGQFVIDQEARTRRHQVLVSRQSTVTLHGEISLAEGRASRQRDEVLGLETARRQE
jgi:hypothetical protein